MGRKINFGAKTHIMGILNVTPDSFFDGGKYTRAHSAIERVKQMVEEGADIIDIGGESTRPGADPVPLEEELQRVIPIIDAVRKEFPDIPISIDTYKSKVALEALKIGADIVNDISGLTFDPQMAEVAAEFGSYVVIMHIKGTPKNMQVNPEYSDVIDEISAFFEKQINYAVKNGIDRQKIILDPGIGFGKKLHHNLRILNEIETFKKRFDMPVLVGASRKSMIGMVLGGLPPEQRLEGTIAITAYCAYKDVDILRVHDVKSNARAVKMVEAIKNWQRYS